MPGTRKSLTAVQEILLAAVDLASSGQEEFSEWDLTVNTWTRNKNRFGCRGYEGEYPDHKRVMKEIMSQSKANPIRRGWMEKTRPNYYRVTALGLAQASTLTRTGEGVEQAIASAELVYDAVAPFVNSKVFHSFCKNSLEPRMWLAAASFLGITRNEASHLEDRLTAVRNAIRGAKAWMRLTGRDQLRRGVTAGGISFRSTDLEQLSEFMDVLEERFEVQMDAIRREK